MVILSYSQCGYFNQCCVIFQPKFEIHLCLASVARGGGGGTVCFFSFFPWVVAKHEINNHLQ